MSPTGSPLRATSWASSRSLTALWRKYIQDFAENLSAVFDAVFPHVVGAPPTPVAKNADAFYQWALANNYPPIGFYSAYPGLSVQDIRALLTDYRKSRPAPAG